VKWKAGCNLFKKKERKQGVVDEGIGYVLRGWWSENQIFIVFHTKASNIETMTRAPPL